jgi:hypothetical protein
VKSLRPKAKLVLFKNNFLHLRPVKRFMFWLSKSFLKHIAHMAQQDPRLFGDAGEGVKVNIK